MQVDRGLARLKIQSTGFDAIAHRRQSGAVHDARCRESDPIMGGSSDAQGRRRKARKTGWNGAISDGSRFIGTDVDTFSMRYS